MMDLPALQKLVEDVCKATGAQGVVLLVIDKEDAMVMVQANADLVVELPRVLRASADRMERRTDDGH
jgi:hypothetical protein